MIIMYAHFFHNQNQLDSEEHFHTRSYANVMEVDTSGIYMECDEYSLLSPVQATEFETTTVTLVTRGCKWKESSQGNTVKVTHCGSCLNPSVFG